MRMIIRALTFWASLPVSLMTAWRIARAIKKLEKDLPPGWSIEPLAVTEEEAIEMGIIDEDSSHTPSGPH